MKKRLTWKMAAGAGLMLAAPLAAQEMPPGMGWPPGERDTGGIQGSNGREDAVPGTEARSDQAIQSAVQETYVFREILEGDAVEVRVDDGQVTLSGTVSNQDRKDMAARTAENIAGVQGVDNRLEVREQAEERSDTWIGMKVKSRLLLSGEASGLGTDVTVNEGVVTLRGEADTEAKKELAAEVARNVEGVQSVDNQIKVRASGKGERQARAGQEEGLRDRIDDASITAMVNMNLLLHRGTSSMRTEVSTEDGVVTLTGRAQSQAEKELATRVAEETRGVRRVVNNMTVDEPVSKRL